MSNKAVFFDLDGTLIDTAPDLALSLNILLKKYNQPLVPYAITRNESSNGAKGLVSTGFKKTSDKLIKNFLDIYKTNICVNSRVFPSINNLLVNLNKRNIKWGIITNKPRKFTEPLLSSLDIKIPPDIVICGDDLEKRKPHPMPIIHAMKKLNLSNNNCVYVGDALRDIQAGNSARVKTIAVKYGYIKNTDNPSNWGADIIINRPFNIFDGIKKIGFL